MKSYIENIIKNIDQRDIDIVIITLITALSTLIIIKYGLLYMFIGDTSRHPAVDCRKVYGNLYCINNTKLPFTYNNSKINASSLKRTIPVGKEKEAIAKILNLTDIT